MTDRKKYTLDSETVASRPGRVTVEWWTWFRAYPTWPSIYGLSLVGSAYLAYDVHLAFLLLVGLSAYLNWFYWIRVHEHFAYGDTNPGIIISVEPMRYAVATDLCKDLRKNFPAVRVIQKRFRPVTGEAYVGQRIMTVALYGVGLSDADEQLPHWCGFEPRPVDCAIRDQDAVEKLFAGTSDEDWQLLEEAIADVSTLYQDGLYAVHLNESTWAIEGAPSRLHPPARYSSGRDS